MTNVDPLEFHKRVRNANNSNQREEYQITLKDGGDKLTQKVYLEKLERDKLLDEISKLPDEMLGMLEDAEDEEEAQELAEERGMLTSINGDTVNAFENMVKSSMTHSQYTDQHKEDIVNALSFEVLFEMGSKVIEMSFEDTGAIKDFQKVD